MSSIVLAMDTSTPRIVAGVVRLGDSLTVLAESSANGATAHAEQLAPSVSSALRAAGTAPSELDGIVVGLGPGPFTGLRVGIMTAAAMSDALGIPAWGVLSLAAVDTDPVGAVIVSDARRKEVYVVRHDGTAYGAAWVEKPAALIERLRADPPERVIRAGAAQYDALLRELGIPVVEAFASPAGLVTAAAEAGLIGGPGTDLTPVYIRRPDAAEPKPLPPLEVRLPEDLRDGS